MPSNPSAPLGASCPKCGQRLVVRAEMAGRRGRCAACSHFFRISLQPVSAEPPPLAYVSFACSLCQTRMTYATNHVESAVRCPDCPDCGRKNIVPSPPKAKAPVIPAAMFGEQYELVHAAAICSTPLAVGASLVYFRLIGLLGWSIA